MSGIRPMGLEQKYAPSTHVLLDLYGASNLVDETFIRDSLYLSALRCGAVVLNIHVHSFGEGQGVTGVALLAESHISIHTWPESRFAALDIFMCGHCEAIKAVEPLKARFLPHKFTIKEIIRGA